MLLDRSAFRLPRSGLLHHVPSGRKFVLDELSGEFFDIAANSDTLEVAAEEVTRRYAVHIETARKDLTAFLEKISPARPCADSILPGEDHAVLEPTARCNGGCSHCYHSSHGDLWAQTTREKVLEGLERGGIRTVSITGGEVFSGHFANSLFELGQALARRNIEIASISTNAIFLTDEIVARIAAELSARTVIRISLDAMKGEVLDRLRPGYRSLPHPYEPIAKLDASGFHLVFTTNLTSQAPEDIIQIGEFIDQFEGAGTWNVRPAVPVHVAGHLRRRKQAVLPDLTDLDAPLGIYEQVLRRHAVNPYKFNLRLGNYLTTSLLLHPEALEPFTDDHPCREDKTLMTVKANGAVTQCPVLSELDSALVAGNLTEPDYDLPSPQAEALPLAKLSMAGMVCAGCSMRAVCGGGCRLYALAYDAGLQGCDPVARRLMRWIDADESGVLEKHWPDYLRKFRSLVQRRSDGSACF